MSAIILVLAFAKLLAYSQLDSSLTFLEVLPNLKKCLFSRIPQSITGTNLELSLFCGKQLEPGFY